MQPRLEILDEKKLAGRRLRMSFAENKTRELWQSFMPARKRILSSSGTDFYSVEIYEPQFFENFDPKKEFEKWAAVEVKDFETIAGEMERLILPGGLYAVFIHKGPAAEGSKTYEYIFRTWLPSSEFSLDSRPHFALMGEKYKQDDPSSEEEIWIPVKPK